MNYRVFALAAVAASMIGTSSFVGSSEAGAATSRPRVVDHRPGHSQGGYAIPQRYRIKCVIPFCSHDFKPGPREQVRDHRGPPNRPPKR